MIVEAGTGNSVEFALDGLSLQRTLVNHPEKSVVLSQCILPCKLLCRLIERGAKAITKTWFKRTAKDESTEKETLSYKQLRDTIPVDAT